jgi:hypothetical protein
MNTSNSPSDQTVEDCRNESINKFLAISHNQFSIVHREAFNDYTDYLSDLNGPLGCSVIAYSFIVNNKDCFTVKMFDNHLNLLLPANERAMSAQFATMLICNATDKEIELASKREPTPENTLYAAEQYYKQWVTDDEKLSSLASMLLYFISVYAEVYQYKTLMIRLDNVGSNDSNFQIKMSNGIQTIDLSVSYPVIEREYKKLLKRVSM